MNKKLIITRFDKGHSCRFWFHDVLPECQLFATREDWIIDCFKNGYQIGQIKNEQTNRVLDIIDNIVTY